MLDSFIVSKLQDNKDSYEVFSLGSSYDLCDLSNNNEHSKQVENVKNSKVVLNDVNNQIPCIASPVATSNSKFPLPPLNPLSIQNSLLCQSTKIHPVYQQAFDAFKSPFNLPNF
ncbi:MAG: hypothetical protein GY705_08460, partial [Bacteroidetes bacterium]|nr:hypothetical protein [Bacteroidota bacterium]